MDTLLAGRRVPPRADSLEQLMVDHLAHCLAGPWVMPLALQTADRKVLQMVDELVAQRAHQWVWPR